MRFAADERGQSVLVGTILLFGILIIAFSSYQAFVVPNQNAEVEFNHNNDVQTDMQDLRNSLLDIRSVEETNGEYRPVSEHRPTRVRLGTDYPARIAALNPPAPSGTIETLEPAEDVRIEDATVAGGEFESSPDVLLDDDFETTFLRYRPGYNEFQDPPDTVFEHSLLYNDFRNDELTVRGQTVIRPDTNRINLVLFSGDISRSSSQAVTLDPETLDGPTGTVPIEPENNEMQIQLPTRNTDIWEEEADELDISANGDSVTVTLEEEYKLRVTRVGFDGGAEPGVLTPIQRSDIDSEQMNGGVGQGGQESWSPENTTRTISTQGGVWEDVGEIDSVVLANPRLSPIDADGDAQEDERYFRLAAVVGDPPGGDRRFVFVIPDDSDGMEFEWSDEEQEFDIDGDSPEIVIYEENSIEAEPEDPEEVFSGDIISDKVDDWYLDGNELSLLDSSIYDDLDTEEESALSDIQDYLRDNDGQEAFVTDIQGRADLTLENQD